MDSVLLFNLLLYVPLVLVGIVLVIPRFLHLQPIESLKWQPLLVIVITILTLFLHTFKYRTDFPLATMAPPVRDESGYLSVMDVMDDPILPAEFRLMAYGVLLVSVVLMSIALISGTRLLQDEYLYLSLLGTMLHCLYYLAMILVIDYFTIKVTSGYVIIDINPVAVVVLLIFAAIPLTELLMLLFVHSRDTSIKYQPDEGLYPQNRTVRP